MNRLRQLGKDSVVYGVGGALSKSISFFLLPVYTRIFTPADYGTIEMMTVIVSLLTAVLTMGMDSAQSFFFFEQKKNGREQQKIVVSSILQWRMAWGVITVLLASGLSPLLNGWLFEGELSWVYFAVSFSYALFITIMSQSIEIFRLLYRPWPYIVVGFIQVALSAASILVLVLIFEKGIFGYFLGSMLASLLVACLGWFLVREYINFSTIHYSLWPRILRFGLPLLPAGLAFYMMSTMDRWFIQYYYNSEVLGIYAVGAKFSMIIALVIETFRKAWWPIAMDSMQSEDGPETFRMIAQLYTGIGVSGIVLLTLIAPWLVEWLTPAPFHSAWPVVGVLAWQSLFYGFYLIGSVGIWKVEKTYFSTFLMGGAALLNLGLNYFLVPEYGGMGAAIATVITFFLWVSSALIISERCWKIGFPIRKMALQLLVGAIIVGLVVSKSISIGLWETVLIVFISITILISGLNMEHRTYMFNKIKFYIS
jgi:O-antigen/teichoic acid export membrane protein